MFSTFSVLVAAAGFAWGLQRYKEINFLSVPTVEAAEAGEPVNWLLVGSDSRDGIDPDDPNAGIFLGEEVFGKRTDTIIVARVDPELQTIDLLSVPRDLWVTIDGTGERGRINAAFNGEGGEQRLVATVENFLDIEINNYAEINFVGFQEVIDSLEGVPVWFGNPARDQGSGLDIAKTGCHILDGAQSLAFTRGRTYEEFIDGEWRLDPTGDLGRIARQRIFLFRSIAAAKGQFDLARLASLDDALTVGGQNLLVEDGASMTDLLSLARVFASTDGENFVGHSLPVEDYRTSGGAQVLQLREAEADAVLEIFRQGTVPSGPAAEVATSTVAGTEVSLEEQSGESTEEAGESEEAEAEPEEPASIPITFPDEEGYGRFGYAAAANPAGTPCG
ncbi:MAG: LCP family protein [Acidimicrobiales bacterium]